MKFDHISAIYHLLEEQVAEATQAPSSTPAIPLYPQTLPVMSAHHRKSSITTGETCTPAAGPSVSNIHYMQESRFEVAGYQLFFFRGSSDFDYISTSLTGETLLRTQLIISVAFEK